MDNMQIRKAQLEKLDKFVKSLYDECKVFSSYMNMEDLETLYLHIHELIEEMLQCKNTDEFMKMIQDLHQAVAGVLIVAIPAKAEQVKDDMDGAYADFQGNDFDELLKNLTKASNQKYGNKDQAQEKEVHADPDNNVDDLVDMLDLKNHVKPTASNKQPDTEGTEEPAEDAVGWDNEVFDEFLKKHKK